MIDDLAPSGAAARPDGASRPARLTVRWPRVSDPRLHVAGVLLTVQVLGQVSLGFDLSIAQILVSLGTAATIEILMTAPGTRVVAWPASALLSGNGVALILRVPGTEHGDWFSLRGWYVFAATAALAVLSKYVIRWDDRPLFNPSNLALVVTFLVVGAGIADPQDLWWGPMSVGLALTYAVVVVGGVVITRRLHLLAVSATFWAVFAAAMAVVALAGHSMTARWSLGPVEGAEYWTTLALSPEILIFLFFMITDPRTAARGRTAGLLYAASVGVVSGVLVAFQRTEYATKVALLAGLVLVCAARPLIERVAPAGPEDRPATWFGGTRWRPAALGVGGVAAVALLLVGATVANPPARLEGTAEGRLPEVPLTAEQRPQVRLGAGLDDVGGSFGRAEAGAVVEDLVRDVLLADLAVETGDRRLAELVAVGPYRRELLGRPSQPAPERTVRSAVVDVVRDPDDFQATPRLAVTVRGTEDGRPWTTTYHVLPTATWARIEREVPAGG